MYSKCFTTWHRVFDLVLDKTIKAAPAAFIVLCGINIEHKTVLSAKPELMILFQMYDHEAQVLLQLSFGISKI